MCAPSVWNGSTVCLGMLVWKRLLSCRSLEGWRKWCGYAFGLPDRHPTMFGCGAVRCPCGVADALKVVGGTCGAWWFENWIVDASKENRLLFSFAYRDFARLRLEFGFEIDRFVIIFSVMICRLAILLSGNLRVERQCCFAVVPLARAYGGCLGRQYR